MSRLVESVLDTFERLVAVETDDCVIWPRGISHFAYGKLRIGVKHVNAHRLALTIRVGPCPPRAEAAHGPCHNPACMNYRHLSWKTRKDNHADKLRDGTSQRGELAGRAVLTDAAVFAMRQAHDLGATFTELAERFGVDRRTATRAIRGETWSHL